MKYTLLVFLAALFLSVLCVESKGTAIDGVRPRRKEPNSIRVMTGPGRDLINLFLIGYERRVKSDLSLGIQVIGSDRNGFEGVVFGLGYHFGDPE